MEGREVYELIEELTGQDLMPESMKKSDNEPEAPADPEDQGKEIPVRDAEEDPGLAGGSLPSPATT